jgi:serine/threonine-protein kinase RsbT
MALQRDVTPISSDLDIVTARSRARDIAKGLGFGSIDQARIATAVSELGRNIFLYAGKGTVTTNVVERNGRRGIEFEFKDKGPGISNVNEVMQDGYTTSRGMGMGLPGAKRLMDDFEITSIIGQGTTIMCRKWR